MQRISFDIENPERFGFPNVRKYYAVDEILCLENHGEGRTGLFPFWDASGSTPICGNFDYATTILEKVTPVTRFPITARVWPGTSAESWENWESEIAVNLAHLDSVRSILEETNEPPDELDLDKPVVGSIRLKDGSQFKTSLTPEELKQAIAEGFRKYDPTCLIYEEPPRPERIRRDAKPDIVPSGRN